MNHLNINSAKTMILHIEIIIILQKLEVLACFQGPRIGRDKSIKRILKILFFQIKMILIVSSQDFKLELILYLMIFNLLRFKNF